MTASTLQHRTVSVPRLLRLVDGRDAVIQALAEFARASERPFLLVHSGARSGTGYGAALLTSAVQAGLRVSECIVDANTEESVAYASACIRTTEPGVVLGVGGGRVLDVAKLAAASAGVDFVSIPTQAASDGICSPVAVILSAGGRPRSIGARIPVGIVVDMVALGSAPGVTWQSGLGDLVSNISAVRDWRIAHARRGEAIDDFACLTSEAAALSVVEDDADLGNPDYRQKLIRGLILSGVAMEMAGSSRPASGSEHLISHALDQILDRPQPHGLQVALGTIAACLLRGEEIGSLVRFFRRMGLPVVPTDLGISVSEFIEAVRAGPSTRPNRSTFLTDLAQADLDRLRDTYLAGSL